MLHYNDTIKITDVTIVPEGTDPCVFDVGQYHHIPTHLTLTLMGVRNSFTIFVTRWRH
jgi:hypothetical protein